MALLRRRRPESLVTEAPLPAVPVAEGIEIPEHDLLHAYLLQSGAPVDLERLELASPTIAALRNAGVGRQRHEAFSRYLPTSHRGDAKEPFGSKGQQGDPNAPAGRLIHAGTLREAATACHGCDIAPIAPKSGLPRPPA